MMRLNKKLLALLALIAALCVLTSGCSIAAQLSPSPEPTVTAAAAPSPTAAPTPSAAPEPTQTPSPEPLKAKYVFLFIGDGMGENQTILGQLLASAQAGEEQKPGASIFEDFPVRTYCTTNAANGDVTDSAAAATAISSGKKTNRTMLNIDPETGEPYITLTQTMKENGFRTGIITTVSNDHATPAGFIASTDSRKNREEIAAQGIENGFVDFWAGGGFDVEKPEEVLKNAKEHGFALVDSPDELAAVQKTDEKTLVTLPDEVISPYMSYEIDRRAAAEEKSTASLADVVSASLRAFGDDPFFIMCESGMIDLAAAFHDPADTAWEVIALRDAVNVALDFAERHPGETLIVVTADHETCGLELNDGINVIPLMGQTHSRAYISALNIVKNETISYQKAMQAAKEGFGIDESALGAVQNDSFKQAYEKLKKGEKTRGIDAFTAACCDYLSDSCGLSFTAEDHTATPVALFAMGTGQELFSEKLDNVDIRPRLLAACGIK